MKCGRITGTHDDGDRAHFSNLIIETRDEAHDLISAIKNEYEGYFVLLITIPISREYNI